MKERVFVMHELTWSTIIKDKIMEKALQSNDPMMVLNRWNGIEVIIDNELPFNHVEIYEKEMYDKIKRLEGGNTDESSETEV